MDNFKCRPIICTSRYLFKTSQVPIKKKVNSYYFLNLKLNR